MNLFLVKLCWVLQRIIELRERRCCNAFQDGYVNMEYDGYVNMEYSVVLGLLCFLSLKNLFS